MRLSTGIILSILSANVFAIEHSNGAYPSSLLARRAVVADTDGPFLQKRNNDKEPEEQDKPKKNLFLALAEGGMSTQRISRRMIPIQTPTLAMTLKRAPQTSLSMTPVKMMGLRREGEMVTQALILTKRDRALLMPLKTPPLEFLVISGMDCLLKNWEPD
ncbi:hypothetical protein BASA61_001434 [Batrachochytrium salamandrivorans]|nr:hypothetical protein BASA62_005719 [Batrachochytrium salamandrivorans]KAH6602117.1 hypothetical protein BASA61_001434 [Batrachochytrium salamandrivorans]